MYAPTDGDGGQTPRPITFDDATQAEQAIKAQFQVMMQQNVSQVFQAKNTPQFFEKTGINHPEFSFIKVE